MKVDINKTFIAADGLGSPARTAIDRACNHTDGWGSYATTHSPARIGIYEVDAPQYVVSLQRRYDIGLRCPCNATVGRMYDAALLSDGPGVLRIHRINARKFHVYGARLAIPGSRATIRGVSDRTEPACHPTGDREGQGLRCRRSNSGDNDTIQSFTKHSCYFQEVRS
jgi:hypothetical protein